MNSTRSCSLKTSFHFRAYRRCWLDAIAISHRSNKTLGNELRTGCRDFSGKLVHLFTVNSFESNHLLFLSPTLPQERSFSGRQTSSIRSQANACIHYFHVSAFFFTSCSTFSPFLQLPFADPLYFANLFLRVALKTLGETLVSPKNH